MRYKGQGGPPPQFIRVAPEVAADAAVPAADSGPVGIGGDYAAGGVGGGSASAGGAPLIKEVLPGGEEDGTPAFALLASKRQQRQTVTAAAQRTKQQSGTPSQAEPAAAAEPEGRLRPQEGQQGQGDGLPQLQPRIEYQGKPATAVCISVPLPPAAAVTARRQPASVQASVCAQVVRLRVPGCQPLEVQLPFAVNAAGASAELAAEGKGGAAGASLLLRLPYRPFSSVLAELRGAAAAAEGRTGAAAQSDIGGGLMSLD